MLPRARPTGSVLPRCRRPWSVCEFRARWIARRRDRLHYSPKCPFRKMTARWRPSPASGPFSSRTLSSAARWSTTSTFSGTVGDERMFEPRLRNACGARPDERAAKHRHQRKPAERTPCPFAPDCKPARLKATATQRNARHSAAVSSANQRRCRFQSRRRTTAEAVLARFRGASPAPRQRRTSPRDAGVVYDFSG